MEPTQVKALPGWISEDLPDAGPDEGPVSLEEVRRRLPKGVRARVAAWDISTRTLHLDVSWWDGPTSDQVAALLDLHDDADVQQARRVHTGTATVIVTLFRQISLAALFAHWSSIAPATPDGARELAAGVLAAPWSPYADPVARLDRVPPALVEAWGRAVGNDPSLLEGWGWTRQDLLAEFAVTRSRVERLYAASL